MYFYVTKSLTILYIKWIFFVDWLCCKPNEITVKVLEVTYYIVILNFLNILISILIEVCYVNKSDNTTFDGASSHFS